jgi:hypothetical protein
LLDRFHGDQVPQLWNHWWTRRWFYLAEHAFVNYRLLESILSDKNVG